MCPPEPAALSEEQIRADPEGLLEQAFDDGVLFAGRACRDALKRVCEWHRDRGDKGLRCDLSALSRPEVLHLLELRNADARGGDRHAYANDAEGRGKG